VTTALVILALTLALGVLAWVVYHSFVKPLRLRPPLDRAGHRLAAAAAS
jgi:hypothetical protein